MGLQTIPVAALATRSPGFLSHPWESLSRTLAAWKRERRRRADARLLMKLEPYMLRDIGVTLAEHHGASAMLKWHPAVLATTMRSDDAPDATEY